MNATYECPKCAGKGFLTEYAGIAGGICFCCDGKGFKTGKKPVASQLFPISAIEKTTGTRMTIFRITAKSETEAIKKATIQLGRGKGYIPETAQIGDFPT